MKARAYYIGGFSVGCPVLRVEVLEQIAWDTYSVKVTSPDKGGFRRGEVMTKKGYDLYDKYSISSGPRCHFSGQEWKKALPEVSFEKPMFYLTR